MALLNRILVATDFSPAGRVAVTRAGQLGVHRMPVVGAEGKLVGIVTVDDMLKRMAADTTVLTEIISQQQSDETRTRR